jgi:hypothetical protein
MAGIEFQISMRLLFISKTYKRPESSTSKEVGIENLLAVVPGELEVKSFCPRTTSGRSLTLVGN